MQKFTGGLMIVGILLALPFLVPVALTIEYARQRRRRKVAHLFQCTQCGNLLGAASLRLADEEWSAYLDELQKKHPSIRFRMFRSYHAICATCGCRYYFDEKVGTFTIVEATEYRAILSTFTSKPAASKLLRNQ